MIASLKETIGIAKKTGGACAAFNTPNLENLFAALDAAQELDVPLILSHAQLHEEYAPLDRIGRVMRTLAESAAIPVCLHLDHGEDEEYCKRAIGLGFNSVMIDYSALPYEENMEGTRRMTEYAHRNGVQVEAELGRLPQREGGGEAEPRPEDLYTDPALVPGFLAETGVDALAIAFGTAHGIYKTEPHLDFGVISKIRALTDVPLVMHGGSGVSHEDYRKAIACGIGKINYYTYMSYAGYAAAADYVKRTPADFYHNLAATAQSAMKKDFLATLRVFSGKE